MKETFGSRVKAIEHLQGLDTIRVVTFFVFVVLVASGDDDGPILADLDDLIDEEDEDKSRLLQDEDEETKWPRAMLILYPYWESFTGLNYREQMISGTLYIEFIWNTSHSAPWKLSRPDYIIDIKNFASGSSDMIRLEGLTAEQFKIRTATTKYAGAFTQHFDKTCFPFDEVKTQFRIALSPPGPAMFEFELICSPSHQTELADGTRAFLSLV